MRGIVAHVGLAHVGLRQHRGRCRRIAAGDDRLEALGLDDARRQRVVGAGHQRELLVVGHDGAEFLAGVHGVLPKSKIKPVEVVSVSPGGCGVGASRRQATQGAGAAHRRRAPAPRRAPPGYGGSTVCLLDINGSCFDADRLSFADCSHGCAVAMRCSQVLISPSCFSVSPMSSRPSSRRMRSAAGMSNLMSGPPGPLMVCVVRSTAERRARRSQRPRGR